MPTKHGVPTRPCDRRPRYARIDGRARVTEEQLTAALQHDNDRAPVRAGAEED